MAFCYFNGEVISEERAAISIHNIGVTRGFGVFDFFRSRDGKPVFLEDHLDRFDRSQKFMDLSRTIQRDEIHEAIEALTRKNGYPSGGFKLVLFADGKETDESLNPLFYITHTDMKDHQPIPEAGLIMHEYVRPYAHVKSIHYLTSQLLHRRRVKAGAIDILYHENGIISEASRSNVFIVKEGRLRTPAKDMLEGITRKQLLSFAPEIIETRVEDIALEDVLHADEVFLSSTLKEVMPVVRVEGRTIAKGRPGPVTQKIQSVFYSLLSA